jgi:alpha-glucosidase
MKKPFLIICLIAGMATAFAQKKYTVISPNRELSVQLNISDSVYYQLTLNGKVLITPSAISLQTSQTGGKTWKVSKAIPTTHNGILQPVIWQQSKTSADNYAALHLDFTNGLAWEWKVFNNGVAWRWVDGSTETYTVTNEQAAINMPAGAKSWYPQEDAFFSHNERAYKKYTVSDIDDKKLASLPVLFDVDGTKILLTESSLFNYAGMWVRGNGKGGVRATFPYAPKEKKIEGDRSEKVVSREPYIAQINGRQDFPWRILMVAKTDGDLLVNQLPYLLGRPATGDYSWVKPGKVQWDWWHYNNIYNVDFRAGINNATYKYYIDFAARYGIEYVLLDEGWCDTRNLFKQAKDINIEELAAYAKSKHVGLLLWTSWLVLDQQMDKALDQFQKWGIKGIKVDFMQRDDQDMVNYYEKVAIAAGKRKMMVDFHGAYKPTGWSRSYPNVITSEGVMGNEISKFSAAITPDHTTTIPFIRMAAGPMDFTPGGMLNVQKNAFAAVPSEPMTLGTRCNQMAMYVVFNSPLQMLCDMPTHYYREPECMQFLQEVPTVWQQTIPLQAKVGEYVAVAKQAPNNNWFIGAMTNWTARNMELNLSFLGEGTYTMELYKDGINADQNAKDFKIETIEVDKTTKLKISMTTGGGFAAIIFKKPVK